MPETSQTRRRDALSGQRNATTVSGEEETIGQAALVGSCRWGRKLLARRRPA